MINNLFNGVNEVFQNDVIGYINSLQEYPIKLVLLIIDLSIVIWLLSKIIKIAKDTRAWQLIKGIVFLLLATWISGVCRLTILNHILNAITDWGVLSLVIIFQPEIRRGLEQLGTSKISKYIGLDKDIATKTKEAIYKIVIAATELSKEKTGALIVIERDIEIKDIINTGVQMNSEISPQLLTNIFVPNTPLHDGAVVISNNKISAAACMLPLASDRDISQKLGTRHRAAIGISKESDSIAVVVSEETGKISVAKDGTLIADVREDVLKKILISNIVTKRFADKKATKKERFTKIKQKFNKKTDKKIEIKEENKN